MRPRREIESGEGAGTDRGIIRSAPAILALLTGLNLLNYIDRTVMAAVVSRVQSDLSISSFASGSLATVFLTGFFITSPVFGALADRSGRGRRKRLLAAGIAIWSGATIASGLAHTVVSLFVARAMVGVGEASYVVIAPTFIDASSSSGYRTRAMSVFSAAIPVGSALGYVLGGAVLHSHGWRAVFFVAGAPGLLLALLCLMIAEPSLPPVERSPNLRGSLDALRSLVIYRRIVAGYCAYTFALGGFAFWAPKYLHTTYRLDEGYAGISFGAVTVAAGFAGTMIGGWLGDWLARASKKRLHSIPVYAPAPSGTEDDGAVAARNALLCACAAGCGAPLAALAILSATPRSFYLWSFLSETCLFLLSGPVNIAILRSVPAELRATAMSTCIFFIHLFGDLWSPPFLGLVADHARMNVAMLLVPLMFFVAATIWRTARTSNGLTQGVAVR
jgi:MFS family permease